MPIKPSIILLILGEVRGQAMQFKAPDLSHEEQFSVRIPGIHACSGCRAVAYQIHQSVDKQRHAFTKQVVEDDAIDTVDSACDLGNYQKYGLIHVSGRNKLNGPGILYKSDKQEGFVQMNGGLWPQRLSSRCHEIAGDIGEEDLVVRALGEDESKFWKSICSSDCKGRREEL